MYVANSEPAIWQRGGGRAGVCERDLISDEPNRSWTVYGEVMRLRSWTVYGEVMRLTQGSPPDLTLEAARNVRKPNR